VKILFAYDGSAEVDAAIAAAGKLLGGRDAQAIVLSVWEPVLVEAPHAARLGGRVAIATDVAEVGDRSERDARRLAERGTQLAGELGFNALAAWVSDERDVAAAIVRQADEPDVELVVVGSRGLTGISAFLGSVSQHVLQHAHRPLLVIPPDESPAASTGSDQAAAVPMASR
jgi:nucleotide-binding universal stress UspA family protein